MRNDLSLKCMEFCITLISFNRGIGKRKQCHPSSLLFPYSCGLAMQQRAHDLWTNFTDTDALSIAAIKNNEVGWNEAFTIDTR